MRLRTKYTERLPTAPGLRLDIPMFEGSGSKVLDVSGKGNHGTIHNAVWTRDVNGVAMSFNGTSAYIDCGNDSSLNITDAITIEAWIKFNDFPGAAEGRVIIRKDDSYALTCYGSKLKIYIWGAAGQAVYAHSNLSTGQWYHIVGTYDKDAGDDNINLYVDGIEVATNTITGSIAETVNNIAIGSKTDGGGFFFNGTIDEVRIYAVALTAEQIKRRYEQTKRDYVRAS